MAAPPLTERELVFLRALGERQVPYLIVGLAAAALQGAPIVTQDVDLWFDRLDSPGLAEALRQVGGAYVAPTTLTAPMFAGQGLELFDIVLRMDGLEAFDAEWSRSLELSLGDVLVRVLPLARIITSKRAAAREKDRLVIPVLEQVLALQAARSNIQ